MAVLFAGVYYADSQNNLAIKNPRLAAELHPTMNKGFFATEITPVSYRKFWWRCSKCNHEWIASVTNRAKGSGCPQCGMDKRARTKRANYIASKGSVADKYPDIARRVVFPLKINCLRMMLLLAVMKRFGGNAKKIRMEGPCGRSMPSQEWMYNLQWQASKP